MEPDNLLLCHWTILRGSCIQSPRYYIPSNYTVISEQELRRLRRIWLLAYFESVSLYFPEMTETTKKISQEARIFIWFGVCDLWSNNWAN